MSLEIDISEPHKEMLESLEQEHGGQIHDHIRQVVEAEIHESYQQLRQVESE